MLNHWETNLMESVGKLTDKVVPKSTKRTGLREARDVRLIRIETPDDYNEIFRIPKNDERVIMAGSEKAIHQKAKDMGLVWRKRPQWLFGGYYVDADKNDIEYHIV